MDIKEEGRRGWYQSRGLPHRDELHLVQAVTFRLIDSLPKSFLDRYILLTEAEKRSSAHRQRVEQILDEGQGECLLRRPEIAELVVEGIQRMASSGSTVFSYVVMPTHVDLLFQPAEGIALGEVMRRLKGRSAREANVLLNRFGQFWAADYFDRFIRDARHFDACVAYIHRNPVKANLCARCEEWPWSSAWEWKDRGTGG